MQLRAVHAERSRCSETLIFHRTEGTRNDFKSVNCDFRHPGFSKTEMPEQLMSAKLFGPVTAMARHFTGSVIGH
jgi:hypothetical protein